MKTDCSRPVFVSRRSCHSLPLLVVLALVTSTTAGCTALNYLDTNKASELDLTSLAKSQASLALVKAEAAEQTGEQDEAIRYYEKALSLDSELEHLSRRLAVLYDRRGDDVRARKAYEHALQYTPRDPELLNDYGVFHLHREKWAAAETWFRRALAIDGTHQRATNNLAMALTMQNRLSEGFEAFSHVVGPAGAYSNVGVLLTRQGRFDEAKEHFHRALEIDSTVHTASEFLSQLNHTGGPAAPLNTNSMASRANHQTQ